MNGTELGIVGVIIAANAVGLLLGYVACLCIDSKPQKPNETPVAAATAKQTDCASANVACPENMPDDMLTAEFARRGETDDSIRREFERRVALQMQPINERAAKLAKDAWRGW